MARRFLLSLAFLLVPPATRAAGAALDRSTLRGLKSVAVIMDVLDPELEKAGITRDALVGRVLSRLQAERITVDPAATEFVGLRLTAVRVGRASFAVSESLGMYQAVLLSRDHAMRTSTQTWEVETVLMADTKKLPAACAETAGDLAARFATAYHSVNPQQP